MISTSKAESGKYDDIINLDRPPSGYPKMSRKKRAAQFAPFAALSSHGEMIAELERQVDTKIELDEAGKAELDAKITEIMNFSPERTVTITHFVPDLHKDGGKYQEYTGVIKKINPMGKYLLFQDDMRIDFDNILDIK